MKRLLICIMICFCCATLSAQSRVFCEIVEKQALGKKVKVMIDFGQKRKRSKAAQTLVNESGKEIAFNSKIDALNHMDSLGWNFLQAYTVVSGSSGDNGSTSSEIHWLLYKDVTEGIDPYIGIETKESYKK